MADTDPLRRDFEAKRDEYIRAQREFSDALMVAVRTGLREDLNSLDQKRQAQEKKHDAYYAAANSLRTALVGQQR